MQKATLKCDNQKCDWSVEIFFDNVPRWHNAECPCCHKCIIVNDNDMVAWHQAKIALLVTDMVDPDKKMPRHDVKIDTATLR